MKTATDTHAEITEAMIGALFTSSGIDRPHLAHTTGTPSAEMLAPRTVQQQIKARNTARSRARAACHHEQINQDQATRGGFEKHRCGR